MPLQPDKMASRVGLGPRAVVWRLLFIASVWRMEVIYYYVLYILTGSWFAHCQLTLPTSPRIILNIGSIHAKSEKQHTAWNF